MQRALAIPYFLLILIKTSCLGQGSVEYLSGYSSTQAKVITNAEYREFITWVRDSIARRILAEEVSIRFVKAGQQIPNTELEKLNWKVPIKWNVDAQRQALDQMFISEHERFYQRKRIDAHKLYWVQSNPCESTGQREKEYIAVYPDTLCWITDTSQSNHINYVQENLVKYYFWHRYFDNYPVQGISQEQAQAFICWKRKREGNKTIKMLDGENNAATIKDHVKGSVDTGFWKISNAEYKAFCSWVRDSLARRILGDNLSEDYLIMQDKFGDEIDPPKLNWKKKIDWSDEETRRCFQQYNFQQSLKVISKYLNFEYCWLDMRSAAHPTNKEQRHKDRSVFIIKDLLAIYPDTIQWLKEYNVAGETMRFWDGKHNTNVIAGITYPQARAFYIWKLLREGQKIKRLKTNPIAYFVIPSKEQWQEMNDGADQKAVIFREPIPRKVYYYTLNP
ncbi:MAG TPA: hypothetical protein EYM84_10425 [Flavobacteriales bacterium]|nr:hypothetical protein [Flavobacteriales bacterium]HIN40677.1 hypothetical protein [Flavobacteriales bacterium]